MGNERVSAEDLHQALEAEIRKMSSGADWARWLDVAALLPSYGFGNVVLINLQMPQANWVARAQDWERRGRRVMKQNAIRILQPVLSQTAMGAALQEATQALAEGGHLHQRVIGFRVATVYDVTATVGPPIHLPRPPGGRTVPNGLWDALTREAVGDGFTVDVRPTGDASEGFTDYDAKVIVVADHLDDFTAVGRLAHEVGHVRLHSAPNVIRPEALMYRGIREVEAESLAYIVLAHHGLSIETSSFDYVASWATHVNRDDPGRVIKATGSRVINAARELISSTDKYMKAHRTPLPPVPARSVESPFLPPDADGPVL